MAYSRGCTARFVPGAWEAAAWIDPALNLALLGNTQNERALGSDRRRPTISRAFSTNRESAKA
jgi:hypothetical protein